MEQLLRAVFEQHQGYADECRNILLSPCGCMDLRAYASH